MALHKVSTMIWIATARVIKAGTGVTIMDQIGLSAIGVRETREALDSTMTEITDRVAARIRIAIGPRGTGNTMKDGLAATGVITDLTGEVEQIMMTTGDPVKDMDGETVPPGKTAMTIATGATGICFKRKMRVGQNF